MTECIPIEEMGTLEKLPADDPRRKHAATCPRCSTLRFAYEEFVRADIVDDADPRAAEMHLEKFIATNVVPVPEPTRVSGAPRRERGRTFGLVGWRSVLVAATVVIVAVALLRWQPWVEPEIVYRGESRTEFTGLRAVANADGSFDLWWNGVEGADEYRVSILSEDLSLLEILKPLHMRISDGTEGSTLKLSAQYRPANTGAVARYWQVNALVEGGVLLTSDPQRLP